MRAFRLPPWCKQDRHSSGVLRSVDWLYLTDVSAQPMCLIFKRQAILIPPLDCLTNRAQILEVTQLVWLMMAYKIHTKFREYRSTVSKDKTRETHRDLRRQHCDFVIINLIFRK